MAVADLRTGESRGIGTVLRELVEGSAELVRGEARLARLEFGTAASAAGRGTGDRKSVA